MANDKPPDAKPKSSGSKTAEGRAAVRPNTIKYGLSNLVLSTESEADFEALLDSYEAEHKPTTATEKALVAQLATSAWRLRRLHTIEASLYKLNAGDLVADASDKALTILARQQARLERSFHKALHELQRLRARRSVKVASPIQEAPAAPNPSQRPQPAKQVPDFQIPVMTNIPTS
jgi:hypothetical protein